MAHHSSNPVMIPELFAKMSLNDKVEAVRNKIAEMQQKALKEEKNLVTDEKFGATGAFPEGKIHETDEGEIRFGVTTKNDTIFLFFGKPIAWIGMKRKQTLDLAISLLREL